MFDWITSFLASGGVAAVAMLMFAENVFPPIPSELVMPLAGFTAARGEMSLTAAILAGSAGSLCGATLWYYVGLRVGAKRLKRLSARHGRWLALSPSEIDHACSWFNRHGGKAVLIGRLVPGVRTLISVPAGVSGMHFIPFILYTAVGTVAWTTLLALAGWWLQDSYDQVSGWLGPISNVIVVAIVLWYLWRVATFRPRGAG